MNLAQHSYGKARVKVLRLNSAKKRHHVAEFSVDVVLLGDFERAYTNADNTSVVATDTMKNIIYLTAHELHESETEPFALTLARKYLDRYKQVTEVSIKIIEVPWQRMPGQGEGHPHSFQQQGGSEPVVHVKATRAGEELSSGFQGLALLKTTESGFAGFVQDEVTTLPEVVDRLLGTRLDALWRFRSTPRSFSFTRQSATNLLANIFASTYSHSVQDSLWRMGTAVLEQNEEVDSITLSMPNLHYHEVNVGEISLSGSDIQVFLPTQEPHGHIQATITRDA